MTLQHSACSIPCQAAQLTLTKAKCKHRSNYMKPLLRLFLSNIRMIISFCYLRKTIKKYGNDEDTGGL